MSIDTLSPYAMLYTDALPIGIPLQFEFRIKIDGTDTELTSKNFVTIVSE